QAYVSYLNHRCLTRSTLFPYTTLFRSSLFKNADFVLMFATIGLILVLLMIIYRSPLLAVIPLVVAGMVYMVTDRVIGMGGDNGWFVVDSQATSIMMILLFAVLTEYSLFVLSRYRSELRVNDSK